MTFAEFEVRCQPEAAAVLDRMYRYISSPKEHDLAYAVAWPFVVRAITGKFPWEWAE